MQCREASSKGVQSQLRERHHLGGPHLRQLLLRNEEHLSERDIERHHLPERAGNNPFFPRSSRRFLFSFFSTKVINFTKERQKKRLDTRTRTLPFTRKCICTEPDAEAIDGYHGGDDRSVEIKSLDSSGGC